MSSLTGKFILIGLLNLILFIGVFTLLQHENIYQNTLGKISYNYSRVKVAGETQIHTVQVPFVSLSNSKFQNWDADIYHCIKEEWYKKEGGCYSEVKSAFFPLFPLIWKVSGLNNIGISLLNYLLFVISVSFLVRHLLLGSDQEKLLVFSLLITLPSTIIYYIPYTEALFLFTMTLAFAGHRLNKYWLYFISIAAMAMLRPATLFIFLAIIAVELLCLFSHRKKRLFLTSLFKKIFPFLCGYTLTFLIQYSSTSSLNTMKEAQKYWQGSIGFFNQIADWSLEGFGLNVVSIFFVAIPALTLLLVTILRRNYFNSLYNESMIKVENVSNYFLLVSLFYLSGILVFILFSSGGNLHSFFRFTMTSPAFYIVLIITLNCIKDKKPWIPLILWIIPLILLTIFLALTEYGGGRLSFTFTGMYLSIPTFCFLFFRKFIPQALHWTLAGLLILLTIIWNSYLLNIFLNEAWIFT